MNKNKPIQDLLSMSEDEIFDLAKNDTQHFTDTVSSSIAHNFQDLNLLQNIIDIVKNVLNNNLGNKDIEDILLGIETLTECLK